MARTSTTNNTAQPRKFKFTRERVDACSCLPGKSQTFYWDEEEPGLGLRVTNKGAKSFIYESKLGRQTVRLTIGPASMPIRAAKDKRGTPVTAGANIEASRFASMIAQGRDPRAEKAAAIEADQATRAATRAEKARTEVTGLMAWTVYCAARKSQWGDRNYHDHQKFAAAGGESFKRGTGTTQAGPLYSLLKLPLATIDAKSVQAWAVKETKSRATRARLGFRLLRAFLNWCAEQEAYRDLAHPTACRPKETREKLGKAKAKSDALQREQLESWFKEVMRIQNPVASAYLQSMLLTGARPEELRALRWVDVDFQWKSMTIGDKIEDMRVIPLTPYVAQLLTRLPRRNGWVFSSASNASPDGRIADIREPHVKALKAAGLPHVSLHGLRRSFGSLAEWVECAVGIVAQIQGHKPSAIAEKHYRVRPLDLLRVWHIKIEAFILECAKVEISTEQEIPNLQLVSAA